VKCHRKLHTDITLHFTRQVIAGKIVCKMTYNVSSETFNLGAVLLLLWLIIQYFCSSITEVYVCYY